MAFPKSQHLDALIEVEIPIGRFRPNNRVPVMIALVTVDGALALPLELRERLGLTPGQMMEVGTEGGLLVAYKTSDDDQFEKWRGRGRLPSGQSGSPHEYLHLVRDSDDT